LQYSDIERAYYYRDGDAKSNPTAEPGDSLAGRSGLFYGDPAGTYKPAAHAVRFWSKFNQQYIHLLSTDFPSVGTDSTQLWVLAGEDDDNGIAVIVSNTEK